MAIAGVLLIPGCDRRERPAAPVEAAARPAAASVTAVESAPVDAAPAPVAPLTGWATVAPDQLCVTSGKIEARDKARFAVEAPTFRAVTTRPGAAGAELRFTYLGATATTRALGSGAVRRQLGLKLRAEDPCNLVYVMWRLDPEPKLVVSIKRNPGERTSAECGNRGYTNVPPRSAGPLPAVAPGSTHVLRAEMRGASLDVQADGVAVWRGDLGAAALALEGPFGVRSDNVRFEGELSGPDDRAARPCKEESDPAE